MTRLSKVLLVSGLLASTTPSHSRIQPQETTRKATQIALAKEMKEETPMYSITIKDLEGGPYFGKKKMITPNYENLLGFSQAETILRGYNAFPDSLKFSPVQRVEVEETINIPLIYPELKEYFPEKRDSLLHDKDFEKYQDIKTDHLLVASQCDNGKVALAYYKMGNLHLATYISVGIPMRETKTYLKGKYAILQDENEQGLIFRRSRKFNGEPMPYSLRIKGGYYIHQGESDGKPKSHGCIRVPGLYQKRLFEQLPKVYKPDSIEVSKIPVMILEGLYTPTLFKQEQKD